MDNRLRNHDLLTSLDVLTTGSYRRLPTIIKVWTFHSGNSSGVEDDYRNPSYHLPRLTDDQVSKILTDLETLTRFRLTDDRDCSH
jgi:mediator of RNA polymerase II transcription subunit 14